MRTEPSVDAPSERFTPLLPKGTDLYVISGPKHGSGYHWYEVSPVPFPVTGLVESPEMIVLPESTGWVAVASRGGEAWLANGKAVCPAKPADVMELARLTIGARLACFSGVPITVQARILHCNCSITGPCDGLKPEWFWNVGEYLVIVPPATRPDQVGFETGVELRVDPKATHPDPIPVDKVVTVTGMFDHPAAAGCQRNEAVYDEADPEPVWVPTDSCRGMFAVTSIR